MPTFPRMRVYLVLDVDFEFKEKACVCAGLPVYLCVGSNIWSNHEVETRAGGYVDMSESCHEDLEYVKTF